MVTREEEYNAKATLHVLGLEDGTTGPLIRHALGDYDGASISPNGKVLAVWQRSQSLVTFFDALSGKSLSPAVAKVPGETSFNWTQFRPDGRHLLVRSDNHRFDLLEVPSGRLVHSIQIGGYMFPAMFSACGRMLAVGPSDFHSELRVIEVSSGKTRLTFRPDRAVSALRFSPDGRRLASGYYGCAAMLWTLEPVRPVEGDAWQRLIGDDAAQAWAAMWTLRRDPKNAVALVKEHVHAAPPGPSAAELSKLLAALDAEEQKERDAAQKELARHGLAVESALHRALKETQSAEVRRRVRKLLEAMPLYPPDVVVPLRAVELMEMVGTAEAKKELERLAGGEPSSILTHEAKAALARIKLR